MTLVSVSTRVHWLSDPDEISADVRVLIGRHFDSVVQLELLLLLQAGRERAWTADEVARELRIEPAWTAAQLDHLASHRLLRSTKAGNAAYTYEPATPELSATLDRLARAYTERRVSLIALIYSKPADSLRTFADAFRFRKDPKDG